MSAAWIALGVAVVACIAALALRLREHGEQERLAAECLDELGVPRCAAGIELKLYGRLRWLAVNTAGRAER